MPLPAGGAEAEHRRDGTGGEQTPDRAAEHPRPAMVDRARRSSFGTARTRAAGARTARRTARATRVCAALSRSSPGRCRARPSQPRRSPRRRRRGTPALACFGYPRRRADAGGVGPIAGILGLRRQEDLVVRIPEVHESTWTWLSRNLPSAPSVEERLSPSLKMISRRFVTRSEVAVRRPTRTRRSRSRAARASRRRALDPDRLPSTDAKTWGSSREQVRQRTIGE